MKNPISRFFAFKLRLGGLFFEVETASKTVAA